MFYLGCLPVLLIVLVVVALSLVRGVVNTLGDIVIGLYLTVKDFFRKLFLPKPLESKIENMDYFVETEEKPKIYDKEDGEYVSFKELD
ncbi:MAG: hypothetical protein IJP70_00315 [Bacteroidales bacterium]|nr:hypothetical protein [Bacteroidales bacterium]